MCVGGYGKLPHVDPTQLVLLGFSLLYIASVYDRDSRMNHGSVSSHGLAALESLLSVAESKEKGEGDGPVGDEGGEGAVAEEEREVAAGEEGGEVVDPDLDEVGAAGLGGGHVGRHLLHRLGHQRHAQQRHPSSSLDLVTE